MNAQVVPFQKTTWADAETATARKQARTITGGERALGPWPSSGVTVVPNMNPAVRLVMWVSGPQRALRLLEYPITGWASPRGERRGQLRSFPVCPVSFNPFTHDRWALVERTGDEEIFHWPNESAFPMTRTEFVRKIRGPAG